jgi:putative mRNA 3-end processing factor
MQTIRATEAERIYLTHGYSAVCARYLVEQGIDALELPVDFASLSEADEGE